jgi:spermidine/putrescine-binding protein
MKLTRILIAALLALVLCTPALAQQKATLNLLTAGDQNMVDYVKDYLAPMFEKEHPGVTVRAVGTGPGDAGSQKIYEKLEAEKDNSSWDIDVAVIHQKAAGEMVTKGLLARYVPDVPTRQARQFRSGKASAGRQCRWLRDPDV